MSINIRQCVTFVLLAAACVASFAQNAYAQEAKNVILMISDGLGFNGWEAARYYEGGLPYDDAGFNFYGMTTYMQNVEDAAGNTVNAYRSDAAGQDWVGVDQGYDSDQMWSDFNYHRGSSSGDYSSYTGSAAAATAMYTGSKTYRGACSYDVDGNDLTTIAEYFAAAGRSTGAVSSVEISHATPACVDAHNYDRNDYAGIANEMIYESDLDVIMGAGDPTVGGAYKYIGGEETWQDITGDNSQGNDPDGVGANGFTFVNSVSDFAALADGTYAGGMPSKVLGIANANYTLNDQYDGTNPETVVPSLETMTQGALNVLGQNSNGFFLMVEGGAVDWENHANDAEAMMAEQVDFDNSVQSVMDWIEANGGWEENLLIVTADHECGGIWGPDTLLDDNGTGDHLDDTVADTWNKVVDNGEGNMPGVQYTSGGHTNALVPMWTKGVGADLFDALVDGNDPTADLFWGESQGWDWNGDYVDNTDIFGVMLEASNVPEPSTVMVLCMGLICLLGRTCIRK